MKKDISMPKVVDVHVAVVKEQNEEGETQWNVYVLNTKNEAIENVLISSKGYREDLQGNKLNTSTLRHFFKSIEKNKAEKVEPIMEDLFKLHNEYFLSFYHDGKLYDKKYIFLAETIKEDNFTQIPILNTMGVLIK